MARQDATPRDGKLQSKGRKANAAQPLEAAKDKGGPERYPSARADDAVEGRGASPAETRSFEPGDHMGPAGDPAEGKR